jgi:hypothetical protein
VFVDLVAKANSHRRNNNYSLMTDAEIEDRICQHLTPASQAEFCAEGARIPASVPWTDVADFLRTAGKWLVGGLKKVPQAEAERRASICATCPYNRGLAGGCAACQKAVNLIREEVLHNSTAYDGNLQACAICHCDNRATVHIPISTLETVPHNFSIASWCWRNPTSANYCVQAES